MSKAASVENKNISLRCCGTFHNPIFCLYFFLGCIFLYLSFSRKTLAISGTPELTALPVKAYCRWLIPWGIVHLLLCRHWHRHNSVKLLQINAQYEVGEEGMSRLTEWCGQKVLRHLEIIFLRYSQASGNPLHTFRFDSSLSLFRHDSSLVLRFIWGIWQYKIMIKKLWSSSFTFLLGLDEITGLLALLLKTCWFFPCFHFQ